MHARLLLLALTASLAACSSGDTTEPQADPLAGLHSISVTDSAGNAPPATAPAHNRRRGGGANGAGGV